MVKPWADAGFKCICVDVQHSIRKPCIEGNVTYQWGDVRSWTPPGRAAIVFAFPPCTNDSVSGARDFLTKGPMMLADSLALFNASRMAGAWSGAPYMIEHPVTALVSYVGKPNESFQPWEYGDLYSKKTCLWTGNGFVMPQPIHTVEPEGVTQKIWTMPPSQERQDERSKTPAGFARAVFEANVNNVRARLAA